jgi:hypothetical protein
MFLLGSKRQQNELEIEAWVARRRGSPPRATEGPHWGMGGVRTGGKTRDRTPRSASVRFAGLRAQTPSLSIDNDFPVG